MKKIDSFLFLLSENHFSKRENFSKFGIGQKWYGIVSKMYPYFFSLLLEDLFLLNGYRKINNFDLNKKNVFISDFNGTPSPSLSYYFCSFDGKDAREIDSQLFSLLKGASVFPDIGIVFIPFDRYEIVKKELAHFNFPIFSIMGNLSSQLIKDLFPLSFFHFYEIYQKNGDEALPLNIEEISMVYRYANSVKRDFLPFCRVIASLYTGRDVPLYELTINFFKKNFNKFYRIWEYVCHEYTGEFWFYFWNDQLWKARVSLDEKNGCGADKKEWFFANECRKRFSLSVILDAMCDLYSREWFSFHYGIDEIDLLEGFFLKWFF